MLKLSASVLVVAGVTGVSLLAAGEAPSTAGVAARAPVTSRPPAASQQPRTTARGAARAPASAAAPVSVPRAATHAPARPQLPAAAVTAPDCAAVGRHMAELMFDEFPSAKQFPAGKRAKFIALRSESEAQKCALEKWSPDRRQCLLGATDYDAKYACAEDGVATPDEVTSAPPELQCEAVAKHLAELTTAPGAKFDIIAKKLAQAGKAFDLDDARMQLTTQTKLECEEIPWSVSLRRCIANAKTHDETAGCW